MSLLDKAIAAVTPPENEEDRAEARRLAQSMAEPGDWLSHVLDHHQQIERAFARAKGSMPADRDASIKALALVLNGHSIAEELVLYPALAEGADGATMLYEEQQMTKVQMAKLEKLDPASQDWVDKLEHIEGAIKHHVYEEEGTKYPRLKQAALAPDQQMLTQRFVEEFERYTGNNSHGQANVTGRGPAPLNEAPLAPNENRAAASY